MCYICVILCSYDTCDDQPYTPCQSRVRYSLVNERLFDAITFRLDCESTCTICCKLDSPYHLIWFILSGSKGNKFVLYVYPGFRLSIGCLMTKKVYSYYCRIAFINKRLKTSNRKVFAIGKKLMNDFINIELMQMLYQNLQRPSIASQLTTQLAVQQKERSNETNKIVLKYLMCQGLRILKKKVILCS